MEVYILLRVVLVAMFTIQGVRGEDWSILLFYFLRWKRNAERYCSKVCCRLIAATFSAVISVRNR